MPLDRNYVKEINEILMTKRSPDDIDPFTLYMPEHKFKKNAEKFNYALTIVYNRYKDQDVKLFHIILALQEFFDMEPLVQNVLDPELTILIKSEMEEAYHMNTAARKMNDGPKESN
jgi:hypothetical protein